MPEHRQQRVEFPALLSPDDLHWFHEGTHCRLYQKLGAHAEMHEGIEGVRFSVWAPNAEAVSVIGDFSGWDKQAHPLSPMNASGVWTGFVARVREAASYKFHIVSRQGALRVDKADPFGFCHETPPLTASVIWDLSYEWRDSGWMTERGRRNALASPIAIYEVHIGSWRRVGEAHDRPLTYRELALPLAEYVLRMGFTHVEFLPVMEHSHYASRGYHVSGYFAPSSRYGTPQDLMFLIDFLHQQGIGVILDWVPAHFAADEHGLALFDGAPLYEPSADSDRRPSKRQSHPFDFERPEVRSFLLSSAFFWLDKYHADGLRVDALESMLYLDRDPSSAELFSNHSSGKENLAAVGFLRRLNEEVYRHYPDAQTFALESSGWPAVSRPTYSGGLGFGFRWDMESARATLRYFAQDPIFRKYHHHELTVRATYAFYENFVLPLSHFHVASGQGSLPGRMPGDDWNKFANLRLLLAWLFLQPGKKLLFMGSEFGQWREWNHDSSLDWHLLHDRRHAAVQRWVADLNRAYRAEQALHEGDAAPWGFEWVDCHDAEQSTLAWLRWSADRNEVCLAALNLTPVPRRNHRLGVPRGGFWREILNSDALEFGGSGQGNFGGVETAPFGWHNRPFTLTVTLPPLACVVFKASRTS